MENNTQATSKKSYKEFEKDFLEFETAKKKLIEKHAPIISGFRTERSRGKIELTVVFDGEKEIELYDYLT